MTSYRPQHSPAPFTQCPNLSVVGKYECHHCGDHDGANDALRHELVHSVMKTQANHMIETRGYAHDSEHPSPIDIDVARTTVHQPIIQTGPLITAPPVTIPLTTAPPVTTPLASTSVVNDLVTSVEPPKVKPRGRPRLSKSATPARTNSLSKSAPVDTQWISVHDGPLSTNRQRYAEPQPPAASIIRPAIVPGLYFHGPFRLLELPEIVRHRIWLYLLTGIGPLNTPNYHQSPITRVNRQIRHESLYLLYILNPFKAGHRDTCKSGPAFVKAIGNDNCRLIRHFSWYTAKRTLYLSIGPSDNGYLAYVRGEGPKADERVAEIQEYVQQCCSTVGLGVAEFEKITQVVLRTTPREPKEPKEPKGPNEPRNPILI